ncbi:AGE family epimerase/isomerase [Roseateles asaccharophilus]|uniref:Mannose-6-phosphate isomerase n=1 Tax=Roseateles asaccharophilus TaxID=582607 RepID=A0ABU2AA71_9BURK|nr:AGE family epimerase/isomerase [Roseateles asaccharophilus]MDR7333478.1 mannose-6-phosphate isomerase [Roseateles asaccharophilus]
MLTIPPLRRRAALALLAGLSACGDPASRSPDRTDAAWHRADLDRLLSSWLAHAPRLDGGFQLRFNRAWQVMPEAELELTGQARLVFAFAAGHEITQDARYLAAARRGADFLLAHFVDPVHGGFFHTVTPEGRPRATFKIAYGHAFALLALAQLYRTGKDARHRDAALRAWSAIQTGFFDGQGGLFNECAADFKPTRGVRTQNPVMHMFEALLALHQATGDAGVQAGARRLGDFVVYKLLQGQPESAGGGACIPEWFDDAWRPLPTRAAGGYIDLGHQFEWSHLLNTGAVISPVYGQVAERVLAYALAAGYDDNDGGCGRRAFPDGGRVDMGKGWWQQAECLHALVVTARATGRNDLWRRYEQTLDLVRDQLVDAERGSWQAADALPCKRGGCKDEQPDPYHMVSLHRTALQPRGA